MAAVLVASCERPRGADAVGWGVADTVVARQVASIGELDGPPEYVFGSVSSVAVDPEGVVYVADQTGSTVRAYDVDGRFLGTIGREGEGPGELTRPLDLALDPFDRLYVRDWTRITVFARRDGGAWPDSLARVVSLGRFEGESRRGRTDGSLYYVPSHYYWMFYTHSIFYEVFDSTGTTGDTIPVPLARPEIFGRANYPIADGRGGQPVEGVNTAPFEAKDSWAITSDGSVVTSPGDRYELVRWGPEGDTTGLIRFATTPRSVPPEERRDSAAAWRSRVDTIPVPLSEVRGTSEMAQRGESPDVLPEVVGLLVDPDDRIWVRRWHPEGEGDHTFFDVLDLDGRVLGTVRIPARISDDPEPWVSSTRVVGVTRDPLTDVERVGVFDVAAPWSR